MKKILIGFILISLVNNLFAKEKVIAKIPEASGISYSKKSNTLFVVNDEGSIYEISKKGKILRNKKIGNYDFEGIVVDDKKELLLVAIEGDDKILILSKDDMSKKKEILIKRKFNGIKILKKGGNGIEGLALYKNKLYISNQSNKSYPKEDASVIAVINYNLTKKKQKIKEVLNHGYKDIAGLTFYEDKLFMVSDKKSLLIEYDMKKKKVIKKTKLSKKFAQEGITFDKRGNLFIADDNGQILKIKDFIKK